MKNIPKVVQEGFQGCIDQDFNPDEVYMYGIEMYETGLKRGLITTGVIGIGLGIYLGVRSYIVNKKLKKIDDDLDYIKRWK